VPLNIERLRHVHARPFCATAEKWAEFKGAVDEIGGVVVQSGLVHALLFALRVKSEKPAVGAVLDAICTWLVHEKSPVRAEVIAARPVEAPAGITDARELLVVGFMQMPSVHAAMAIQAEVIRYLAQAKLVASAFKKADTA
jgi:hypothetical protein